MTLITSQLIKNLKENKTQFSEIIATIDSLYSHTPTAFKNGELDNEESQNQGSAKVFSFAKLHNLTESETLLLFAEHYQAVLNTPEATDHQNIRQFMQNGWDGIRFKGAALQPK